MKKAYIYNEYSKTFEREVFCQLDPLETAATGKEVYLLPALATYVEPLPPVEGAEVVFDGEKWFYRYQPEPTPEEIKQQKINELKSKLNETDYIIIKIAEGVAAPEEYADVIAQRQAWRAEINELEG